MFECRVGIKTLSRTRDAYPVPWTKWYISSDVETPWISTRLPLKAHEHKQSPSIHKNSPIHISQSVKHKSYVRVWLATTTNLGIWMVGGFSNGEKKNRKSDSSSWQRNNTSYDAVASNTVQELYVFRANSE